MCFTTAKLTQNGTQIDRVHSSSQFAHLVHILNIYHNLDLTKAMAKNRTTLPSLTKVTLEHVDDLKEQIKDNCRTLKSLPKRTTQA